MYKHILFDADNTLFDFDHAERSAFGLTMDAFSVSYDDEIYSRYSAVNARLWREFEQGLLDRDGVLVRRFEMMFPEMAAAAADINSAFQQHLVAQAVLLPHALELCEKLSRVAALSIVTNGVGASQRRRIEASGIAPYFPRLFISEEIGVPKPDIRFFTHVLDALGNPDLDTVLIVGDSLTSDIRGGMNAGIATCWLNRGGAPVPEGYRLDHVVGSLRELEDILLAE